MVRTCCLFVAVCGFLAIQGISQSFPEIPEPVRLRMLQPPEGKVRMVLDTDTYNEVDDQFALVYALLSEQEIELEAVYAAPFHNRRSEGPGDGMEKSYQEILRLLELLDVSPDDFAFKGSVDYLRRLDRPQRSPAALDLIDRARQSSPEDPLYVGVVGAATNISSAMLIEPAIIRNIVIVWLGGTAFYWPTASEFNLRQDILASRVLFDSGVPLVQLGTRPVVSHLHTTIPELEVHLRGKNPLADYLLDIVVDYSGDRPVWSKVIWDVAAIAWLINPDWVETDLVHSPILTDQVTYSLDPSRHFVRTASRLNRDSIFRDLFEKIGRGSEN